MYRYETHCHTKYTSACSQLDAETLVSLYLKNGYDGIIVTDHFLNGNTTVDLSRSWEAQIDEFFIGYERVRQEGEKRGLKVFFGFEYSYLGTDFLVYGLDREFLYAHPGLLEPGVRAFLSLAREKGALCVQAHPYREADYIDHIRLYPSDVDGIETINAGRNERCNRLADILADEYSLAKTGGSDLHVSRQKMLAGIETEFPLACIADFIAAVKKGEAKPFAVQNIF